MVQHESWLHRLCIQLRLRGPLDSPRTRADLEGGLVLVVNRALVGRGQPGLLNWVREQVGPQRWPLPAEADVTREARLLARKLGDLILARMNSWAESIQVGDTVTGP